MESLLRSVRGRSPAFRSASFSGGGFAIKPVLSGGTWHSERGRIRQALGVGENLIDRDCPELVLVGAENHIQGHFQLLLYRLIRTGNLVNVTSLFYLVPVVTVILDYLVLHNPMRPLAIAGMAAILAGLLLVFQVRPRP